MKLISNNPAIVYGINNKGCNKSDLCHQIIFGFWITAAYIPGKENLDANGESGNKQKIWNGCFTEIFSEKICTIFHLSHQWIYLLQDQKINGHIMYPITQTQVYVCAISWENFYAFPPFVVPGKELRKHRNCDSLKLTYTTMV